MLSFRREAIPSSRFRGVYAFRARQGFKWQCWISLDKSRREHLGTFDTEVLAAKAFDAKARSLGRASECNFTIEREEAPFPDPSISSSSSSFEKPLKRRRSTTSNMRADVPQSRFKGVYFVLGGRWEAKITYRSKSKHIGTFDTEEEAARAFDERARCLGVPERCNYDDSGNEILDHAGESFRGVRRSRNKWRAVISVDGESVNLGMFDTKEQAAETYKAAEARQRDQKLARGDNDLACDQAPHSLFQHTMLSSPNASQRSSISLSASVAQCPPLQRGQWFVRSTETGAPEYLFSPSDANSDELLQQTSDSAEITNLNYAPPSNYLVPSATFAGGGQVTQSHCTT